jgi:hypothetical protein
MCSLEQNTQENNMTPAQIVKEFCKRNGCKVEASAGVPTISKSFGGGCWFIECFDSWKEAVEFIVKAQNNLVNNNVATPWSKPNVK